MTVVGGEQPPGPKGVFDKPLDLHDIVAD